MHVTYWYYRITQCDILSLIIYITYISCLNNENAIVNPRGYDYFRNRWNLVILKHRRSLGVREGALTVQCTLRRRPALISFHVTIPKWVHVPLIKPMTSGQTSGLCSESTRKVQLFFLLSWWWCNTTMGEVHLVVDDNIGYVHFSFDRYCSWGERKYAVLTTCIMLFIPSRFRDSLATVQNELTKRCLWP